jgi:nicotinate-nucleotide adenylyltransferase
MKRIGILGGTFNPVHKGHIKLAQVALEKFDLDFVIFVPSGVPPHKPPEGIAPKMDRLRMLKLALEGKKRVFISTAELNRPGYSYAVDTFSLLKKKYGAGTELYYIMGMDSINDILNWKKPLELFKLCRFIVVTRPGAKIRTFKRLAKFPPVKDNMDKIDLIEARFDIASSEIRERVKRGKTVARLVPPKVLRYIERTGLYKEGKEDANKS